MRADVPSTVARSDDKAVRTWKETHDSAVESYGEGARAHRTAFAALKHTHEKVGDSWTPKEGGRRGPSDEQAARPTGKAPSDPLPTAEGVDEKASVKHLREIARQLEIPGRSTMNKAELIEAVRKANRRATAAAR
ncbi:ChaB family protein [Parafrankia discariae]|uniref:ChaB family protein n=1 Tax=Parafrankia discariae TaxID=365528 RepID=UPI00037EBDC5